MFQLTLRKCVLTAGLVACTAITVGVQQEADAQEVLTSHVLHGGTRCDHVIQLIHCYGVNNSIDRTGDSMAHHSPFGAMMIPDCEFGDLQIMQVNQIPHEDPACGPKFAVVIQNASIRKVCEFRMTAVAIFGRICPTSPNATVRIAEIGPGESLEVHVQLPIEALAMGNRNGQVLGFHRLVVSIDSFDELVETNEANNLKAYDAAAIPIVTPVIESVETTVAPAAIESAATDLAPSAPVATQPAAAAAVPAAPAPDQAGAADPLRSAINKLNSDVGVETETANSL